MAGNGAYHLLGGTFRWLVHRLEDLAGFNEDSLFSDFAENATHIKVMPQSPLSKINFPHSGELKSKSYRQVARSHFLSIPTPLFPASNLP